MTKVSWIEDSRGDSRWQCNGFEEDRLSNVINDAEETAMPKYYCVGMSGSDFSSYNRIVIATPGQQRNNRCSGGYEYEGRILRDTDGQAWKSLILVGEDELGFEESVTLMIIRRVLDWGHCNWDRGKYLRKQNRRSELWSTASTAVEVEEQVVVSTGISKD